MIVDLMKEILSDYRDSISLEKMDAILCGNSLQNKVLQSINDNEKVTMQNGHSFVKTSLAEQKNRFFDDFEQYLSDKICNGKIRKDIIVNFKQKIPDVIVAHWFDIPMDRQLYVFELLMTFILRSNKFIDPLKVCFNRIIDLYTSVAIYTRLLFKNYEDDVDVLFNIFDQLDEIEIPLSENFFDLLTQPETHRENLQQINEQIDKLDKRFALCLEKYFAQVFRNSRHLFKRVFDAELSKFDMTVILTRYNFNTLYDWVLFLVDYDSYPDIKAHDLFKDLEVY